MMERKVKRTGLSLPFHPLQVLSWIITLMNLVIVSLLYMPNTSILEIPILFYFFQTLVIVLASIISIIDPSDPVSTGKKVLDESSTIATCSLCDTSVDPTSKHCGQCNRCVNGFDHHCK